MCLNCTASRCNFIAYAALKEIRESTSKILSIMMCMDLVLNKEKYPDPMAASRKVCSFMAKKLGTSREDLPEMTKSKVDVLAASEPDTSASKLNFVMGGVWALLLRFVPISQTKDLTLLLSVAWFVFGSTGCT